MSTQTEARALSDLAALRCAQAWFDAHIDHCPRSTEWKYGARAGVWKAHGLAPMPSPWPGGSAADDARNAGFQYGYEQARHSLAAGVQA